MRRLLLKKKWRQQWKWEIAAQIHSNFLVGGRRGSTSKEFKSYVKNFNKRTYNIKMGPTEKAFKKRVAAAKAKAKKGTRRTKKEMAAAKAMGGEDKYTTYRKIKDYRGKGEGKKKAGPIMAAPRRRGKQKKPLKPKKKRKTAKEKREEAARAVNKIARVVRKRKVDKKINRKLGKKGAMTAVSKARETGFGVSQKRMEKRIKEVIKEYKKRKKYWQKKIKETVAEDKKISALMIKGRGTTLEEWFKRREPEWFNPDGTKRKGVPAFK